MKKYYAIISDPPGVQCFSSQESAPPSSSGARQLFQVSNGDLSELFNFYLEARKVGLIAEAEALILETEGNHLLTQVKSLFIEATGCSLFYGEQNKS